jgi:hypothetical protein
MAPEPNGCSLTDGSSRTPRAGNQSSSLILPTSNDGITSSYTECRNPKSRCATVAAATVAAATVTRYWLTTAAHQPMAPSRDRIMRNIIYKHLKYTALPFIKTNLNTQGSSVVCSIVLQKSARACE